MKTLSGMWELTPRDEDAVLMLSWWRCGQGFRGTVPDHQVTLLLLELSPWQSCLASGTLARKEATASSYSSGGHGDLGMKQLAPMNLGTQWDVTEVRLQGTRRESPFYLQLGASAIRHTVSAFVLPFLCASWQSLEQVRHDYFSKFLLLERISSNRAISNPTGHWPLREVPAALPAMCLCRKCDQMVKWGGL